MESVKPSHDSSKPIENLLVSDKELLDLSALLDGSSVRKLGYFVRDNSKAGADIVNVGLGSMAPCLE